MPSLLVATDFSAAGNGAVHYACSLATDLRYAVTVLHSYIIPVAFSETPMPLVPVQDMQQLSEEHLHQLVTTLHSQYPGCSIEGKLAYGDVLTCLREELPHLNPALVVLGNDGAGHPDLWMGNTAGDILRHLEASVLAVPAGTAYAGIRNICLACDFKDITADMPVAPLRQWLGKTAARLHILHVDREEASGQQRYEHTPLPELLAGCEIQYHYASASGSVDEGITAFADAHHMDWLAVIPHHHGFWESLFHKSHTKAMVRMSHVPVLALH